jgi:general stress protein YciG|nr:general stress protein [Pseudomonas sp. UBA6554]
MAGDQQRTGQRGGTKETNPGNFANDRERASRAGHKGGQASGGNFANDRQRASEAGRKGGQNRHMGPPAAMTRGSPRPAGIRVPGKDPDASL